MKDRVTAVALVFAVLLIAGLGVSKVLHWSPDMRTSGSAPVNPSGCLELRVLASSEKADLMKAELYDPERLVGFREELQA